MIEAMEPRTLEELRKFLKNKKKYKEKKKARMTVLANGLQLCSS
jgi:hypothetical protein